MSLHRPRFWIEAIKEWQRMHASQHGAALSFYAVFSLAPLLVILSTILTTVLHSPTAGSRLVEDIAGFLGRDTASLLQHLVDTAGTIPHTTFALTWSVILTLVGATGVLVQLQHSLDTSMHYQPDEDSPFRLEQFLAARIRSYIASLFLILCTGFVLLSSIVFSTITRAFHDLLSVLWPATLALIGVVNTLATFALLTILFALIYRFLPHIRLPWASIWKGSLVTTALFFIGKLVLTTYLAQKDFSSLYGAGGGIVTILFWTYATAQMVIFGANLIYVDSHQRSS